MYILQYPNSTAQVQELEDRLRQLSLAYKVEQRTELEEIQLNDGEKLVQGFTSIQLRLDALQAELRHWYYCDC